MPKRINVQRCTRCGRCLPECPNEGITETEDGFAIPLGVCSDCFGFHADPRCETVCPADAIEETGEIVDDEERATRAVAARPDHFPPD